MKLKDRIINSKILDSNQQVEIEANYNKKNKEIKIYVTLLYAINLKMYQDLMFQLAGIPNTSDLAFNSVDLNASAIDRKFYVMNMATSSAVSLLEKALLRRWELVFGRINIKKQTNFDFRDISVNIPKNLPANDNELAEQMLALRGLVSNETIVEKLGYNYLAEKEKLQAETMDNLTANMEQMAMMQSAGLMESQPEGDEATIEEEEIAEE